MRRYNNNGKAAWGTPRPDNFPTHRFGGRNQAGGRREGVGPPRSSMDDGDFDGRPWEGPHHNDHAPSKLDQLLEKFDNFEVWREETDRKFENLELHPLRDLEPPTAFEDGEDLEDDDRRGKSGDKGFRTRNPNFGYRDGRQEERGRRDGRGRPGSGWEPLGNRNSRHQFNGYDQSFDRPASCWDPPQRFQSHMSGYEKPQRVKMHPLVLMEPTPPIGCPGFSIILIM